MKGEVLGTSWSAGSASLEGAAGDLAHRDAALACLEDALLSDLLAASPLSPRLARVLAQPHLSGQTLRGYVGRREEVERWMMAQRNCGRASVMELRELAVAHVYRCFLAARVPSQAAWMTAQDLVEATSAAEPCSPAPPGDIDGALRIFLAELDVRSAEVVRRRFGLDGRAPQTLAEIGVEFGVTRERIRQVEAVALADLTRFSARVPLDGLVSALLDGAVEGLYAGDLYALDADVETHAEALGGQLKLALELLKLSPASWLTGTATRVGRGWLRDGRDEAAISGVADRLRARPDLFPMTCGPEGPRQAAAAAELLLGWRSVGGYLFKRRPGRRTLRTAALHSYAAGSRCTEGVVELLSNYHARVPGDVCSDRDLVIVMEAAPHLFLEIEEGRWTTLGPGGAPPPILDREADQVGLAAEVGLAADETVVGALERHLERVGPTRLGVLIADAAEIVPSGRSALSVGPTLLLTPSKFVRILPGVYALPHQVPSEEVISRSDQIDYLLNTKQARLFALARHAGERWGCFPLWIPATEMRLCRWARGGGDGDLLRSLLAVSTIEEWPANGYDKEEWLDLRARQARFDFGFKPRQVRLDVRPDRFLAAAIHLAREGCLGWISANRIMRYRPDAHAAAALLEIFVRAGLAIAPRGTFAWQLPHRPGPALAAWVLSMEETLCRTGELDWDHPDLAEMAASVAPGAREADDGDDEEDELQAMMEEHRRAIRARRLELQLDYSP